MPTKNGNDVTDDLTRLKDRALSATAEGITIADVRLPDRPIIYANSGFERLTGYRTESVVGRNCRFLQGPETDPRTVTELRRAIQAEKDCTVEILNYRKDGSSFWNRLSVTPVRDDTNTVTHFIGVQSDVSERRKAEEAMRAAKDELQRAHDELKRDLELAARIQQSLLPESAPAVPGLQVSWRFQPCTQLAGDFLNVFALDEDHTGLYILDVSGHGAPAALLSVTLSRWLSPTPGDSCLFESEAAAPSGFRLATPSRVAEHLNQRFKSDERLRQYFTMIYGIFERETGIFRYVAAGHPGPIHLAQDRTPTTFGSTAPPVGLLDVAVFEENRIQLHPGERMFLYTDGVTEARNASDEEVGVERLIRTLSSDPSISLDGALEHVVQTISAWQGTGPSDDDISILGFQVER